MMVYLKISGYIGNQQFSCHTNFHSFLISDTQLSLLEVLRNFKTFCMQEKIRSYLSSLHNAVRSHDPCHTESFFKISSNNCIVFSLLFNRLTLSGPGGGQRPG